MNNSQLDTYAFYWSEVRLIIAAVALFLGGVPPLYYVMPSFALAAPLLKVCWIISGIAVAYLAYRWYTSGQMVFGGSSTRDKAAFFVMVISGLNLGLTGLLGQNIGMNIWSGQIVFLVVGVLYLWAAWHLFQRWNSHGKKLF